MKVTLDNRLKAVLSELEMDDMVADIGCDHGKIANLAVEVTKKAVFAVDISKPSLQKAHELSKQLGIEDKVICLTGDGVQPIEDRGVDTIVIAGMGGLEIIKILTEAKHRYKKYIFVPHRNAVELRHYLCENRYFIKKDYFVKSADKYYSVIVAGGNTDFPMNYTSYGYLFGLTRDKVEKEAADLRFNQLKGLVEKATGDKREEMLKEIKIIENED